MLLTPLDVIFALITSGTILPDKVLESLLSSGILYSAFFTMVFVMLLYNAYTLGDMMSNDKFYSI